MRKIYLAILAFVAVLLASWATTSVFLQQDEGTDLTSKITNPNLDDGLNGWTVLEASGQSLGVKATSSGNPVYTCFKGVFDIRQTIKDLQPGVYTLKVQAFSRPTANADAVSIPVEEQENNCLIMANYVMQHPVALTSQWLTEKLSDDWSSHEVGGQTIYLPNASGAFAEAFKRGMYDNELTVVVGSRRELTFGVTNQAASSSIGDTYSGFDNFRLYYEGALTNVTDKMETDLLNVVQEGRMNKDLEAAQATALSAYKASKSADTFMALLDAIVDASESVAAYEAITEALNEAEKTEMSDAARAAYQAAIADILTAYQNKTLKSDGTKEVEAIKAALAKAVADDLASTNDKTALIKNPQFNDGKDGWQGDFGNGAKKGASSNYVITSYGGGFDVYQTIEGLEPGIYLVQAQAFTRPTDNASTWSAVQGGQEVVNKTYLYANGTENAVKLIVDDYMSPKPSSGTWSEFSLNGTAVFVPNNSDAFSIAFTAGLYENEIYTIVKEDGKLTLGIKNEDTSNSTSYAGFDNFRLTFVGSCDLTDKLQNPNLDDGLNGWTVEKSEGGSVGVKAADTGNPVYTCYNGVFNIYQTLTGLTPGTYKLQVQAFFRPCVNDDIDALLQSGKELENFCYIYANDEEIQPVQLSSQWLTSAGSGTWRNHTINGKSVYLPDNSSAFADAFKRGMYDNELEVSVGAEGKLVVGIRNETATGSQGITYAGFDNFRLTYVSTEVKEKTETEDVETIEDFIAQADACKSIAAQAKEHAAFDEAYTATMAVYKDAASSEEAIAAARETLLEAFRTLLTTGETETGQFDLTALIVNPTFDKNTDGWKMTNKAFKQNSIGVLQGQNITDGAQMTQVLKGMPAGKYTLKVQGFYQDQAWKQALYNYEHGKAESKLKLVLWGNPSNSEAAVVTAYETKSIKSIFDDARNTLASACQSRVEDVGSMVDGRGFPLLIDKVSEALSPGGYWNYLEADVTDNSELYIGVDLESTTLPNNWVILDNFRLYYGERKPIVVKTSVPVTDDTPAEVKIVPNNPFAAGTLIPFSAPCDIPGSKFKAVYEIGSLDASTARKATIFPVENVRAGIPCYVEFAEETDTLFVGKTVLKPEKADTYQLNWDGGVVYPYYLGLFNWRMTEFKKATRPASFFTTVEVQDLDNLSFTANIENYQVRMFMNQKYTQSSSSVVSEYNAIVPARRDLPHAVGIPVPASVAGKATFEYTMNGVKTAPKVLPIYNNTPIFYFTNLIPGNTYNFAVVADGKAVVRGDLWVEGPVRMIYAPSVYNLRDLGGWTVQDGRQVRYGLLYRGGEVNGYHAPVFDDLQSLMDLGIGAEIDLRWRDDYDQDRETNKSGYGFTKPDTYYFAGANDYTAANLSEAATLNRFKEEFQFLMKHIREGRGVHFHCVFGADRTGLLAVLLEGLLGFDLNSLYHDYEFTSFAAPAGNRNKSAIQERIAVIQNESGATLRDKFENFWIGKIGITAADVEEFRTIMLCDPIPVGIKDVELREKGGQEPTVKAVYNLNGVEVPQNALNRRGTYVVRYTNGTSKKVTVK